MSNSPTYVVFQCDTCKRELEVLLDGRRPDPLRCNITLKCRGKLQRQGVKGTRDFLFTPIVPGLDDYIPRGTTATLTPPIANPNPITIFTAGGTGMMAMSVIKRTASTVANFSVTDSDGNDFLLESRPLSSTIPVTASVNLVLYELTPELLSFTKYTYVITGAVQVITGADDSPESRNLRFTVANQIKVYVNGVELDDSQFDRSVDNQINFTPAIYDTNNVVEVFVYKDLTVAISTSNLIRLNFRSLLSTDATDLAYRELNCWGNFRGSVINSQNLLTLFCTDLSLLDPTRSYAVAYVEATSTIVTTDVRHVDPDTLFILLGREPFSFRDKELHAYLSGTTLITDQSILTYAQSEATGVLHLSVNDSAITQTFNPIGVFSRITQLTSLATSAAAPGTTLEGTEELKPKYIRGPA